MFLRSLSESSSAASLGAAMSTFGSAESKQQMMRESVIKHGGGLFDSQFSRYGQLGKMLESDSAQDQYRAAMTLLMMERTQNLIEAQKKTFGEASTSLSLGTLAPRVLDIVRFFYPNQVANILMDLQPIDGQVGSIFVLKPRFSQSHNGAPVDAFPSDSIAALPGLNVNAGDEMFAKPTDDYASEYSSATLGTGNASLTTFTAQLNAIRRGTLRITADTITAVDNSNGGFTGTGVASGTINYATGAVSITFSAAPANAVAVAARYTANMEISDQAIREVEFDATDIPVRARMFPLRYSYSVAASFIAQAHLATDIQDTMAQLVGEQIKIERDNRAVRLINSAVEADTALNFNASMSGVGYDMVSRYSEIEIKISYAESLIQSSMGRGGVSWVLCGINAATVFENSRGFVRADVIAPIGPHVIGYLRDGTVPVIKVPNAQIMPANRYIFGYKGYMLGDSASILAEFVPLYFTPVHQAPTLKNSQGAMSMYDLFINNKGYFKAGDISGFNT